MNRGFDILQLIPSKPILYFIIIIVIITNSFFLILLGFTNYYLIHIGNRYIGSGKKIELRKKYFLYFFLLFTFFLSFSIIYHFRFVLWEFFSPIIWSILLAYLFNPVVDWIQKKFSISRVWSVIVLYIATFLIILFFSATTIPKIIREVRNLMELLPKYTYKMNRLLNELYIKIEQIDKFSPQLTDVKQTMIEYISILEYNIISSIRKIAEIILNFFSHIFTLILIPIFTFYFLKDKDIVKEKIKSIIPKSFRKNCIDLFNDIHILLNNFIRGQLIVSAFVAFLSTIALIIIKIDFAILIGISAGIFNIIPYFGPIIGTIPAIIFALLDEPFKVIWVIITFTIIQQIECNIVAPKILGESVGLHPVIIILVLLAGGKWFGIAGMVFAVPFVASIKIMFKHIIHFVLETINKNLSDS